MTSTSQDQNPAKTEDGSSPPKQVEAQKDARTVPLDALAEARQKARAAEDKLKEMETELARLRGDGGKASAQPPPEISQLANELQEIKAKERLREMTVELGLADTKQADAVAKILAKAGDLTPAEALEIASKRQPDLFKDRGTPGFDPRIHGSLRPSQGQPPEPKQSDYKKRLELAKKATGTDKSKLVNNIVGHFAAKAMGWDSQHRLIPLPKDP